MQQIVAELPERRETAASSLKSPCRVRHGRNPRRRRPPRRGRLRAGKCGRVGVDAHRAVPMTRRLHDLARRRSMTRLALPCERSIVPGSDTRTVAVTPT